MAECENATCHTRVHVRACVSARVCAGVCVINEKAPFSVFLQSH